MSPRVGLLLGRERSFPEALEREVVRLDPSVKVELARLGAPRADVPPAYDVLLDRISHEIPSYQPWLKLAALNGTRVVNDPFWRTVDDKFLDAGLAARATEPCVKSLRKDPESIPSLARVVTSLAALAESMRGRPATVFPEA